MYEYTSTDGAPATDVVVTDDTCSPVEAVDVAPAFDGGLEDRPGMIAL